MLLDAFWRTLGRSPGGNTYAACMWAQMLSATGIDPQVARRYYELMDIEPLRRFGRVGAMCLAQDAISRGDDVRLAAICFYGISTEGPWIK